MKFNVENYPYIKKACENKEEIEIEIAKDCTLFKSSEAPENWTAYPPCLLPPDGYAQICIFSGTDAEGALTRLELLVYLDGGKILYKRISDSVVGLKVIWPK